MEDSGTTATGLVSPGTADARTLPVCHSASVHLWAAERTCCVHADAVTWSEAGGARGRIEFSKLRRVQLRNPPGMEVPSIGLMDLHPASGRRLRVSSQHFLGFGRVEDRAASYRVFVLALHAALAPHAERIRFHAGSTPVGLLALAAVVGLWAALMVFGVVVLVTGETPWWIALVLLGLLPQGLLIVRHLRRHWPRRYDAAQVPRRLLP